MSWSQPWDWTPSDEGWFEQLAPLAQAWTPEDSFRVHGLRPRELLLAAIDARAPVLKHPASAAVTLQSNKGRRSRDLLLLATIADLFPADDWWVELPEAVWVWAPDGGRQLGAGRHDIESLRDARGQGPTRISLDPFGDCLGVTLAAPTPESAFELMQVAWSDDSLAAAAFEMTSSLAVLETRLPAVCAWVEAATQVVLLLPPVSNATHNWSRMDVAGAIYTTAPNGWMDALETLVHESAHRHLFFAEAQEPLCRSSSARYVSPLRPDPRPLRGILLALHAIAYMAAFYADAEAAGLPLGEAGALRRAKLLQQACCCAGTLQQASDELTPSGLEFCRRTEKVIDHAQR